MKRSKSWQVNSQGPRGSWLRFIRTRLAIGSLFRSIRLKPKRSPLLNLFHQCNETTVKIFLDCLCDKNYNALIKHGKAKHEDLLKAWDLIYSEYSDLAGNTASKTLISLSKDISYHDAKLRAVGLCLKVLSSYPDERCIKVLRDYGYDHTFDITNPEQYAKSLETIASLTGNIVFTLQLKRAEYDREAGKLTGKPMTRELFYDQLTALSEHFHLTISQFEKETVTVFLAYKKRYEMAMLAIKRNNETKKIQ